MTNKLNAEENCVGSNTIGSFSDEFLDYINETNLDITTKGIFYLFYELAPQGALC